MGAGPLENGAAEGRKRAGIGHDLRLHALNDTVFVAADRKIHPERVALGMHEQRLGSRELHLDRQMRHVGNERGVVLDGHVLFSAEAAAHELVFDLNLLCAQQQRTLMQRRMGRLVGRQQHHVAVSVNIGNRALWLQERVLGPRRFKVPGDHVFGCCDRARRVAAAHMTDGL